MKLKDVVYLVDGLIKARIGIARTVGFKLSGCQVFGRTILVLVDGTIESTQMLADLSFEVNGQFGFLRLDFLSKLNSGSLPLLVNIELQIGPL